MKHTLEVSKDGYLFTVTTEGDGDVDGIIAFLKDIISHPRWKPGSLILLDHRALKIDKITPSEIEKVSEYFKSIDSILGNGKIALVMNRAVDFGIARAWQMMTECGVAIEIYVFQQLEKALSWLKK